MTPFYTAMLFTCLYLMGWALMNLYDELFKNKEGDDDETL